MLKRMLESEHSSELLLTILEPKDLPEDNLQHEVIAIARQLQMNEIEIAYWSLWLDTFKWHDPALDFKKLLRVTAFQIKARIPG